jgi:hypothetical protein
MILARGIFTKGNLYQVKVQAGYAQFSGIPIMKHAELVEVCVFQVKSAFDKKAVA